MVGCGSGDTSPPASAPSGPAIEINNSRLTHYDDAGRLVWAMDAAAVQYDRGSNKSRAHDVRVRFMTPDADASTQTTSTQTASLTIQARHLVFEHQTRNLFLHGGVRGEGPDGLSFETDRAQWDDERSVVSGSRAVRIQRDDLSMRGTGFIYNLQSESLTMQSASLQVQLEGSR